MAGTGNNCEGIFVRSESKSRANFTIEPLGPADAVFRLAFASGFVAGVTGEVFYSIRIIIKYFMERSANGIVQIIFFADMSGTIAVA